MDIKAIISALQDWALADRGLFSADVCNEAVKHLQSLLAAEGEMPEIDRALNDEDYKSANLYRENCLPAFAKLKGEVEQARVQIAGCSVAAMQNTENSIKDRAKQGAYGWSASYQDVCDAVDREIVLRQQNATLQIENERLKYELTVIGDMAVTDFDDLAVGLVDRVMKQVPKNYAERRRAEFAQVKELQAKLARVEAVTVEDIKRAVCLLERFECGDCHNETTNLCTDIAAAVLALIGGAK